MDRPTVEEPGFSIARSSTVPPARTVLVVCTANQCRSAMAEGLMKARAEALCVTAGLTIESAGTWARDGIPATDDAVRVMAEREIDITAHRSRDLRSQMIENADLVLVMTSGHRESIAAEGLAAGEETAAKVRLFSELGGATYDIVDPVGRGTATYRATAEELAALIETGWAMIAGTEDVPTT